MNWISRLFTHSKSKHDKIEVKMAQIKMDINTTCENIRDNGNTPDMILSEIKNLVKCIEKKIEEDQTRDEVKQVLRRKIILPYKEIITSGEMIGGIIKNNPRQFISAQAMVRSGELCKEFNQFGLSSSLKKRLLIVRTYLAWVTMIKLMRLKADLWYQAEMIRRLRQGLENIPDSLLEEWITKNAEKNINTELYEDLGREVIKRLKRLLSDNEFRDIYNKNKLALEDFMNKFGKIQHTHDLLELLTEKLSVNNISVRLALPEEMTHQFSFIDGEAYPGAEFTIHNGVIEIIIDIRSIDYEQVRQSNIELLIARQFCSILLKCVEKYGFPERYHSHLTNKIAPLLWFGDIREVPGYPRITWNNVFKQTGLNP